ncbi:hypothetical protein CCR96_06375 [Halochromatium roseum]|nr:hypothetical protein [Halochromatium roseum]
MPSLAIARGLSVGIRLDLAASIRLQLLTSLAVLEALLELGELLVAGDQDDLVARLEHLNLVG